MRKLLSDGIDLFIEVGAAEVLRGLLPRIDGRASVLAMENFQGLERLVSVAKTMN